MAAPSAPDPLLVILAGILGRLPSVDVLLIVGDALAEASAECVACGDAATAGELAALATAIRDVVPQPKSRPTWIWPRQV